MTRSCSLTADLEGLQPLAVLQGEIYGLARRQPGTATLVTALGVRHPLRRLASMRVWTEHAGRISQEEFLRGVLGRLAAYRGVSNDLVAYFLTVLAPRVEARDWGEPTAHAPGEMKQAERWPMPTLDIAELARAVPAPVIPGPALVVSGRIWRLTLDGAPGGVHVCVGREAWSPSGEYHKLSAVDDHWRARFEHAMTDAARRCLERGSEPAPAAIADALDELRLTGSVQRGALLLLGTTPPCIAHVMPPHYSATLGRAVKNDVALATTFQIAPPEAGVGGLRAFAKSSQGVWSPLPLPRGICLGAGVPGRPAQLDPDLAVVAYLRWAATRIATNGRFHEHDGRLDDSGE